MVVIIGSQWVKDKAGNSRLQRPDDFIVYPEGLQGDDEGIQDGVFKSRPTCKHNGTPPCSLLKEQHSHCG
jgi:hypothetical protein